MSIWPYLSSPDTKSLMKHFDEDAYDVSPTSHIYALVEALAGPAGAGDLIEKSLIARARESIETTWFRDLDSLFGNVLGIPRMLEETYNYNANKDVLTEQERIEVELKDAWYRARLKDLLTGLQHGGTEDGFRFICRAITSVDSDIYEAWRYRDRYDSVGRLTPLADRELIVVPQKQSVSERERRHFHIVADRLKPADSIVTITPDGMPVHNVLGIKSVAADGSYFEIRKTVTQSVDMSTIPPPEYLAEELYAGEKWLYYLQEGEQGEVPAAMFDTCQEFSQWYSYMPGSSSQITFAEYLANGRQEANWSLNFAEQAWTDWISFPKADSPDNWPGGKDGRTPLSAPALTKQGEPYVFPEVSQSAYETKLHAQIVANGGEVRKGQYRIPLSNKTSSQSFVASATISSSPPKPGILS